MAEVLNRTYSAIDNRLRHQFPFRGLTPDELITLNDLYHEDKTPRYIASVLGVSSQSVRVAAKELGLSFERKKEPRQTRQKQNLWTQEDSELIIEMLDSLSIKAIAEKVGRTYRATQAKIYSMGLHPEVKAKKSPTFWTPDVILQLQGMVDCGLSIPDIAETLGVSYLSVRGALAKFGIKLGKYSKWTDAEKSKLKRLHLEGYTPQQVALALDTSESAVRQQAYKLGLQFKRKNAKRKYETQNDRT
jgi:DNA-binding NarL/FixJ family response regulator